MRVSPFRHPRIDGYLLLPGAFRSLSRLSSAPSAKASAPRLIRLTSPACIALHAGGRLVASNSLFVSLVAARLRAAPGCLDNSSLGLSSFRFSMQFSRCVRYFRWGFSVSRPFRPVPLSSLPMGLSGLEPPTSRLSGVRSNRLSYKPFHKIRHPPALPYRLQHSTIGRLRLNRRVRDGNGCLP